MKIPVAYREIVERFRLNRNLGDNKISVEKARQVLGVIFHFNSKCHTSILSDMIYYGLIEYGHRGIQLIEREELELIQ